MLSANITTCLMLLLFSLITSVSWAKEGVFTVGVVPQFDSRTLNEIWRPILKELRQQTGYKFVLRGSPNIPAFEKEFEAGNFDFVYMNPYHMVMANDRQGYEPLVRDVGRKLYGVLVVKKNGTIKKLEDLDGKTVAFPAPNALGASLMMRAELKERYGLSITPKYVNTHSSSYLNVVLDNTAAGGGVQKTLNQQPPQIRKSLHVLYKTQKVAPHPFSVHPRITKEVMEEVRSAFLTLGNSNAGKKMLQKIPMKKVGQAHINDYLPLKKLGLERYYVK